MKAKKLLRIFSATTAAAALLTSTAITASAAQTKLELITVPLEDVLDGADWIGNRGADVLALFTDVNDGYSTIDKFITVTDSDLAQWRESGEFSYTAIDTDLDLVNNNYTGGIYFYDTGDYGSFSMVDGNTVLNRNEVKYNENEHFIEKKGEYSNLWMTPDGYAVTNYAIADGYFTFTIQTPEGETIESKVEINEQNYEDNICYWTFKVPNGESDYLVYFLYTTDYKDYDDGTTYYDVAFNIVGITRSGDVEILYTKDLYDNSTYTVPRVTWADLLSSGENYVAFDSSLMPVGIRYAVYLFDTNEFITGSANDTLPFFTGSGESESATTSQSVIYNDGSYYDSEKGSPGSYTYGYLSSLGNKIYDGSKAIAYYEPYSDYTQSFYQLIDVTTDTVLSDAYKYMSTTDGEIFLIETFDDKWGYINSNGELLKTFDDASSFSGKYAPVVENGKAYLINKNMKRVSDKIDATGVFTLSSELFEIKSGDVWYLATYNKVEVEDEPADENNDDTTADNTADDTKPAKTDKTSDDTEKPSKVEEPAESTTDTTAANNSAETAANDDKSTVTADDDESNPKTGVELSIIPALALSAFGIITLSKKR